ncbi:hypothetical protein Patl1_24491 [Pistacia atlantica]|uniref:Uncharacterized protein n=1 Tax=Pistacia atlantica TaxID=434234 RepID=A0ACC0ZXM3_9ROSI|nr:hypothetical protein Patl1_24491 [Pistacia atlantica]
MIDSFGKLDCLTDVSGMDDGATESLFSFPSLVYYHIFFLHYKAFHGKGSELYVVQSSMNLLLCAPLKGQHESTLIALLAAKGNSADLGSYCSQAVVVSIDDDRFVIIVLIEDQVLVRRSMQ